MSPPRLGLVEFPADDADRALAFWTAVLGTELEPRGDGEGAGWQQRGGGAGAAVGIHRRGRGPGDSFSLPYIEVDDLRAATARVGANGGTVIHPGERWVICKDSEGNPFALAGPAG